MKLQKIGNDRNKLLFTIILMLIVFYLLYVLFIFPITTSHLLPFFSRKPILLLLPKFSCAILLIIGIIFFKRRPNLSWLLINMASMGLLVMWYSSYFYYFFEPIISNFFLEFIAIIMLILTNRKKYIKRYDIKRDKSKFMLIGLVSIFLVTWNQLMLPLDVLKFYFNSEFALHDRHSHINGMDPRHDQAHAAWVNNKFPNATLYIDLGKKSVQYNKDGIVH